MNTDGSPSAPPAEDDIKFLDNIKFIDDLPEPDAADPADGVNDSQNTTVNKFLDDAFNGEYSGPPPDARSWPKLDDSLYATSRNYFVKPDLYLTDTGVAHRSDSEEESTDTYEVTLMKILEEKELYVKRSHGGRAVATGLLGATGIGLLYVWIKTRKIRPGQIGMFYTLSDKARAVKSGWSYEPNPFHGSFKVFNLNQPHINFNNHVHIVRVPAGHVALCKSNGSPAFLKAGPNNTVGFHVIVDSQFELLQTVRVDKAYFSNESLHIFTVQPGHVRAVLIDRKPHVLFPGRHVIECSTLSLPRNQQDDLGLDRSFSVADLIHYVVVNPGQVGGIRIGDHACFIQEPVRMWFYSRVADVMAPVPIEQAKVEFQNLTRIVVNDYNMGLIQDTQGRLVVLREGVHVLCKPNIHLATICTEWNHVRVPIKAITADPLDVKCVLTFAWSVVNPIAHYKAGNDDERKKTITELARSCMSQIIRHMRFEETLRFNARTDDGREEHHRTDPLVPRDMVDDEKHGANQPGENEGLVPAQMLERQFNIISKRFTDDLREVLLRDFGVRMDEKVWGFQDFDLVDQQFQEKLVGAVVARSEARAKRVQLDLKQETADTNKQIARLEAEQRQLEGRLAAETERHTKLMEAETEQAVLDAKTAAEYKRKEQEREIEQADAKSRADALFYEKERAAKGDALAILEQARAEAEGLKLRAEAERKSLEANPQYNVIRLAEIHRATMDGMNPTVTVSSGAGVLEAVGNLARAYKQASPVIDVD